MPDRIAVIESPRYSAEAEKLSLTQGIREMAQGIPKLPAEEYESWGFISAASSEANRRNIPGVESIGGPARAVKLLHDKGIHAPVYL